MAVRRRKRKAAADTLSTHRGGRPRAVRPQRNASGTLKRSANAARAHLRLSKAVLAGELKHCAWDVLKLIYFGAKTDAQCERLLAKWAKEHDVEYVQEPVRIQAAGVTINTKAHHFSSAVARTLGLAGLQTWHEAPSLPQIYPEPVAVLFK